MSQKTTIVLQIGNKYLRYIYIAQPIYLPVYRSNCPLSVSDWRSTW
ncbi:hypothetical protein [uncultured Methanobrevibacter sp.]